MRIEHGFGTNGTDFRGLKNNSEEESKRTCHDKRGTARKTRGVASEDF